MRATVSTGRDQQRLRSRVAGALGAGGILFGLSTLSACGQGGPSDADGGIRHSPTQAVGPGRTTSAVERLTDSGNFVLVRRVTAASGTVTVTVNIVQYFTGAAARRACAEDGVPGHAGGLCSRFYLRDDDPQVVTLPVRRDALITILSGGPAGPRRVTVAEVGAQLSQHAFFRLDTERGAVVRLTEVLAS